MGSGCPSTSSVLTTRCPRSLPSSTRSSPLRRRRIPSVGGLRGSPLPWSTRSGLQRCFPTTSSTTTCGHSSVSSTRTPRAARAPRQPGVGMPRWRSPLLGAHTPLPGSRRYGFRKLTNISSRDDQMEFAHEHFRRGELTSLALIKRAGPGSASGLDVDLGPSSPTSRPVSPSSPTAGDGVCATPESPLAPEPRSELPSPAPPPLEPKWVGVEVPVSHTPSPRRRDSPSGKPGAAAGPSSSVHAPRGTASADEDLATRILVKEEVDNLVIRVRSPHPFPTSRGEDGGAKLGPYSRPLPMLRARRPPCPPCRCKGSSSCTRTAATSLTTSSASSCKWRATREACPVRRPAQSGGGWMRELARRGMKGSPRLPPSSPSHHRRRALRYAPATSDRTAHEAGVGGRGRRRGPGQDAMRGRHACSPIDGARWASPPAPSTGAGSGAGRSRGRAPAGCAGGRKRGPPARALHHPAADGRAPASKWTHHIHGPPRGRCQRRGGLPAGLRVDAAARRFIHGLSHARRGGRCGCGGGRPARLRIGQPQRGGSVGSLAPPRVQCGGMVPERERPPGVEPRLLASDGGTHPAAPRAPRAWNACSRQLSSSCRAHRRQAAKASWACRAAAGRMAAVRAWRP